MRDIFTALYLPGHSEKQKVWSKFKNIFLFKTGAGFCTTRSTDICIVMLAVGQAKHSLSVNTTYNL